MKIKTPFSYMEETEIISVNGNVATVKDKTTVSRKL